jgi:hypothetical protein
MQKKRIERYTTLSATKAYGEEKVKKYDKDEWSKAAFSWVPYFEASNELGIFGWDVWRDSYKWKNDQYPETHWYQFQQKIKEHQKAMIDLLSDTSKQGFDLFNKSTNEDKLRRIW